MTEDGKVADPRDFPSGIVAFGQLPSAEPYPGVRRQSVSTVGATITRYSFEPGASFPRHTHDQEQITVVEEGGVKMSVGSETLSMGPGEWSLVAGKAPHGIVAGDEGARIVAIIVPRRDSTDEISIEGGS